MYSNYNDGQCPQCYLEGKDVAMLLNQDDFWECPTCRLQAASIKGKVVILLVRGTGDFKSTPIAASTQIVGFNIALQLDEDDPYEHEFCKNEKALKTFLSEQVHEPETEIDFDEEDDTPLTAEEQERYDKLEALLGETNSPAKEEATAFNVFAVWINGKNRARTTIEKGWEAAWLTHTSSWQLTAKTGVKISNFKPWFNVGDNFYLLRLADSWSSGDLCGFMSSHQYIKDADDMLVVYLGNGSNARIRGTLNKGQMDEIEAWIRQGENYRLVNK